MCTIAIYRLISDKSDNQHGTLPAPPWVLQQQQHGGYKQISLLIMINELLIYQLIINYFCHLYINVLPTYYR